MTTILTRRRIWITALVLFIASFLFLHHFILIRDRANSKEQFATHAAILSGDLWALDASGVSSYLQLAAEANHFKTLSVTQPEGEMFAFINGPPLKGIDKVLFQAGLIGLRPLHQEILFNNKSIGFLNGQQYVRIIYPFANILLFLLFLCLALVFVLYLIYHRRQLETTVEEKTRSLRHSEKRFHDLVNLLPEMVWESDTMGYIRYANKAAIDRFGSSYLRREGRPWFDLIIPEQRAAVHQSYHTAMHGQDQGLQEFKALDQDNKVFPVLIRCAAIEHEGRITGARCIAIDITERHLLENELQRSQKMKAIGIMAGGVAHDLNNILSGVVSYPELLLMRLPEDSDLRRPIEAIKTSGMQAAEVVSDLLTVARGVAANKQVHKVNTLINEYFHSPELQNIKKLNPQITFSTDLSPTASNITCSPIHFKKCLMNLVANAAEAIPDRGQVVISSGDKQLPAHAPVDLRKAPRSYTAIRVKDTGLGLSSGDIEHIFEPFYTKKKMGRSGTGLGLTVVWNTMIDHHGWVDVDSNVGQTVFTLYFPSTLEEVSKQQEELGWQHLKGQQQSVLVIDDEKRQRQIAKELLQTLGYQVRCVASGEEAVALLEEETVDILLLDMLMEPGINGLETYKRICRTHPGQKAVIASGYSRSVEVDQTLRLGAHTFVSKPYTIEQLGQAFASALTCN